MGSHSFTREELYDLVWSEAMTKLGAMSDRRIYTRHRGSIREVVGIVAFVVYVVTVLQVLAVIHVHSHPTAKLLVLAPTDDVAQPSRQAPPISTTLSSD
jgi:hypothetical protein